MQPQVRTQIKQKNLYQPVQESLAIWLDATDTALLTFSTGTDVIGWTNKGTTGAGNAAQATANRQPLWVASAINGLPAVQGYDDSTAKQIAIADSTALDYTTFTSFVVAQRVTDLGAVEHLTGKYDTTGNAREHRLFLTNTDVARAVGGTDGTAGTLLEATTGQTPTVGTPFILMATFLPGTLSVRYNNTTIGTAALASVYNGISPYVLFSHNSLGDPFAGYIGEHLFYTRQLTTEEIVHNTKYLAKKWKISI